MLHLFAAAALASVPAAQVSPVPVVEDFAPRPRPRAVFVRWRAEEAKCGGEAVTPVRPPEPRSAAAFAPLGRGPDGPVEVRFEIDGAGRPVGIRSSRPVWQTDASDLAPALAAAQFAAGRPARGCRIAFTPEWRDFAEADPAAVMGYTVLPATHPPREAWDRIKPTGTTCFDLGPDPRLRAYPEFRSIAETAGNESWSMVAFDIDRRGRPTGVRGVAGDGNAALDRASVAAVKRSRFVAEARRGCLYPYWRRGAVLPAPKGGEAAAFRAAGATCPKQPAWTRAPEPSPQSYPDAWRRRGIEGWAVVAFDVAPWGAVGNVRTLAAQPADDFRSPAENIIRQAALPAGPGYVGCVQTVRFAMPPTARAGTGEDAAVPEPTARQAVRPVAPPSSAPPAARARPRARCRW